MSGPENPYKDEVDFAQLALQDAEFAKVLKSNSQLDFSSPETVLQLTKSLFKRDFNLKIELPPDRLCPPVPNRLNYILWIQDLLDTSSDSYKDAFDPERDVIGLDIGTGASCIYPLLGCRQRPKWKFVATDIDTKSLEFAARNVQLNGLQSRIKLMQTKESGKYFMLDDLSIENIDFTMCNPPFYSSKDDMLSSAAAKKRPPFSACTGSETELVTAGGEITFVSKMIDESMVLRDRVQWYTSMLGKSSSVAVLLEKLREKGITNYAVKEFIQGTKTRRWGIGWSFDDLRPAVRVARHLTSLQKGLLPYSSEYVVMHKGSNPAECGQILNETLTQLPLQWMWRPKILTGVGFSEKAVWSRAARREAVKKKDQMEHGDTDSDVEMAFGFKIHVEQMTGAETGVQVNVRWLKGQDSIIFESFCGMIKRKLRES